MPAIRPLNSSVMLGKMIRDALFFYLLRQLYSSKVLAANNPTVVAIQKAHQPQVVLLGQSDHILNIHEHFSY